MKCPKCQYIAFDDGSRCRNCGYEFELAADEPPFDVAIARDDPAPGPAPELDLRVGDHLAGHPDRPGHGARPSRGGAAHGVRRPLTAEDLPLFIDGVADDQAPLVTPPATPRPPLSVRRAAPVIRRGRPAGEDDELPLEFVSERAAIDPRAAAGRSAADDDTAGVARRAAAGLIDVTILGAVAAAVFLITLRLTGLSTAEWQSLPLVPFAAFLLLLSGGYFVLFTAAAGQTIGKMLAGIRVVCADDRGRGRVSFGTAVMRAVACLGSVLAVGAGFVPVLASADRRAFHDRVADTRVVSA